MKLLFKILFTICAALCCLGCSTLTEQTDESGTSLLIDLSQKCTHVDSDKDCHCDVCGCAMSHTDINSDEICDYCGENAPLFSFIVASDTHVGSEKANRQFVHFLDVAFNGDRNIIPVDTVLIAGDLVDTDKADYWNFFKTVVSNVGEDRHIYTIPGNHEGGVDSYIDSTDYGGAGYDNSVYKKKGNKSSMLQMLSVDIGSGNNKYSLIGLGRNKELNWDNDDEVLDWLVSEIEESISTKGPNVPVFVTSHSGVKKTSAGTYKGWASNSQNGQLKKILDSYPNVIFFSGHSHEELEAPGNNYTDGGAHFFDTSSIFYLMDDTGFGFERNYHDGNNSQAYYVEIYSDRVELKGYNFSSQKWITSDQNFGYADSDDPSDRVDKKYGYQKGQVNICRTNPVDCFYIVYLDGSK